jgi:ABC-2 type transport system permease protein
MRRGSWRRIRILLINDLQLALRNWTLLVLLGIPLVVSLVTTYTFGSTLSSPVRVALPSGLNTQFAARLASLEIAGQPAMQFVAVKDGADAMQRLARGEIEVVVTLPDNVDEVLARHDTVPVEAVMDDRSQGATIALGLIREEARLAAGVELPLALNVHTLRGLSSAQVMLPVWAVTVLVSAVTVMPGTLARDRRDKMMAALLVAPVDFVEFVTAKALFGVVTTVLGALLVLLVNGGLTGYPLITMVFVTLGSAVFTLVGLLISILITNLQTALGVSTLAYLVLLYSAFMASLPGAVGSLTKLSPGYYVYEAILHALNGTATWRGELMPALILAGMGLILLGACVLAARKQEL